MALQSFKSEPSSKITTPSDGTKAIMGHSDENHDEYDLRSLVRSCSAVFNDFSSTPIAIGLRHAPISHRQLTLLANFHPPPY